jgi:hypothetical protein
MLKQKSLLLLLISLIILLSGCEKDILSASKKRNKFPEATSSTQETSNEAPVAKEKLEDSITELGWNNLIPEEWLPDSNLVEKYNNGEVNDEDPRIIALKDRMRLFDKLEPVNEKLDGKQVKIPGYVVPVEMDGKKVREFLLVPYFGACVHSPPPPANQTVFVKTTDESAGEFKYFATVWVTGRMEVVKTKNKLAESGYTIIATKVEAYK